MTRVPKKRYGWPTMIALAFAAFVLQGSGAEPAAAQEESSCLTCHTSVRDLVKITRELDAKKPAKSTEISGEG